MHYVIDFIKWALTHIDPKTLVGDAIYPIAQEEIGVDPAKYLYATIWHDATPYLLNARYNDYYGTTKYSNPPMTRAEYDSLTKGWCDKPEKLTDCQGLLDAYMTHVLGEKTDINANMNYTNWCTEKGEISKISRAYVVGEAVFMYNSTSKKMSHVGWICGFMSSGEPLVVEARGIKYGVVITRFSKRSWTHRGLMTVKFDYSDPAPEKIIFKVTNPMQKGPEYSKMQAALNAAGYRDANGNRLSESGAWNDRSQEAFDALIADYAKAVDKLEFTAESADGGYMLRTTISKLK